MGRDLVTRGAIKGPKEYTLEDIRDLKKFQEGCGIVAAWGRLTQRLEQAEFVDDVLATLNSLKGWQDAVAGFPAWFEKNKGLLAYVMVRKGNDKGFDRFDFADLSSDSDLRNELLAIICNCEDLQLHDSEDGICLVIEMRDVQSDDSEEWF